jgi:hypothetical protein
VCLLRGTDCVFIHCLDEFYMHDENEESRIREVRLKSEYKKEHSITSSPALQSASLASTRLTTVLMTTVLSLGPI